MSKNGEEGASPRDLEKYYEQCLLEKRHYDLLSWRLGAGFFAVVSLIVAALLGSQLPLLQSIIVRVSLAFVAALLVLQWLGIYERNRFWAEVANETARDIERRLHLDGVALAFMKAALEKQIVLRNLDHHGLPYHSAQPRTERDTAGAIHFGIRTTAVIVIAVVALIAVLPVLVKAAATDQVAVEVTNASEPVLCAEKDNVTLNLASREVRRFRIEATHPAYIGAIQRDSFAADWTGCTSPGDPKAGTPAPPPKRTTLYEQIDLWVVGLTFESFWRAATATVRIGERVEKGIHLLQVWMIRPMGGEEVAVLYPQDGYWRLRPLAPAGLAPTAFGSSFLIGPVEVEGRPIVRLREVAFEPKSRTFTLAFERGGTATVRMAATDQSRNVLEVAFDRPVEGRPFAALRSMYVTDVDNDVARIAVREQSARGWRQDNVMAFERATATELWAGRVSPSRHNTSSPDMVFGGFAGAK